MIRRLADYDPDRVPRIVAWPVREGLLKLRDLMQRDAAEQYRFDLLRQAIYTGAVKKPPKVDRPKILEDHA